MAIGILPLHSKGGERHGRCATTNSANSSNIHLSLMPRSSPASNDACISSAELRVAGKQLQLRAAKTRPFVSSERAGVGEATSAGCLREKRLRCAFRGGRKAPGNVAGMSHLSRGNVPLHLEYAVVAVRSSGVMGGCDVFMRFRC